MSTLAGENDPGRAARLKERLAALEREIEHPVDQARAGARERARTRALGVDALIHDVFDSALAAAPPRKNATRENAGIAVVALGGYGRAELSPRSDVDLIFVLGGKSSPKEDARKAVVERMLYALWDSGLEIGHAVRTPAECVAVGKQEVTARSSLLDHRFVAGSDALYQSFAKLLDRRLFSVDAPGFVNAKLLEIVRRRERFGAAVSRNEPNLKEGEGGLRDAHTSLWIARAVWGFRDAAALVPKNLARREDVAEFETAFERLLDVRSELHRLAGRKEDRLSFDRQEAVAKALGYADHERSSATEAFMQSLTQTMATVQRFLQLVVDRMPDRFHRTAEAVGAVPRREAIRRAPKGFRVRRGRLLFADPDAAIDAPAMLVRAFAVSAATGVPLHPEARAVVRSNLEKLGAARDQRPAVEAFWELLLTPGADGLERALLEMNDLGALGAFLPEFAPLFGRLQHDTYHVYTCDAHLLLAVANVHRLIGGRWAEKEPLLTELARSLSPRKVAGGVLLHDIGKSEPSHTAVGLRMLPRIAEQLRLSHEEQAQIHFLIAEHLLLSHVSQRRDLSDPQTIADVAARVGTLERLKLLYVLTFCDIAAVGPSTWTDWKGALLRELYLKAAAAIASGTEAIAGEIERRAESARADARALFAARRSSIDPAAFESFLSRLPMRYFATTEPEAVVDDFTLSRVEAKGGLKVQARVLPERHATEVTFQCPDRAALFADLTGGLAAAGLSIRTARIHTTADGVAIDRFEVVGANGDLVDLAALDRMVRDLLWVLTGKQTAGELLGRRKPPAYGGAARPKGKPPRVEITNDASAVATVVDVFARDRLGLLHDIAQAITDLALDIQVALVSTKVDQVADTFYVRELGGGKVTDSSKLERLHAELARRID